MTQNQMLLKNKLAQVLEFCPRPCPPEPCPPSWETEPCESSKVPCCGKSALQLVGQRDGMLWESGCRMSWRLRKCIGKGIRWEERSPAQLQLDPRKAYAVQYTLNVCTPSPAEGTGTIRLKRLVALRGDHPAQAVARRRVFRCAASAFFHGAADPRLSDAAVCCGAVSPREQRL